jgi:hypothetical protein
MRRVDILALAFSIIATLVIGSITLKVPEAWRIFTAETNILGTVNSKDRADHMSITVGYVVDGRRYSIKGRASDFGEEFERIQTGRTVPLAYNSRNPSEAVLGNARDHIASRAKGLCFLASLPIVFYGFLRLKRRYSNNHHTL